MVSPSRGTVEELIAAGSGPASFLTLTDTRAGWFDEPDLVVADLASGEDLFRRPVEPALYAGHSTQLQAELSPDGTLLAVCSEPGAIAVFDVDTQELSHTITGDFQMVEELHFTPDGQWLLVKERYGSWTLLCFDAATGAPREDWPDLGDLGDARVAVDAEGSRVAIADQRSWLRVLDLDSLQWQQEFQVDQVSRSFAVAWLGRERIATRTDLGFVGLYGVAAV